MRIDVITLFPGMIKDTFSYGVTGRAVKDKKVIFQTWDLKDFSGEAHGRVDDRPYGGGPGMILQANPLITAIDTAKEKTNESYVVYLSPQGNLFDQKKAEKFVSKSHLILVAGRYEGIDQRVLEKSVDEECSVGDFVVSGGELPVLMIMDAVVRLIPGVLGDPKSAHNDTFSKGLLEYPQYTRPLSGSFGKVPEVLLSGDHKAIERWRFKQSLLKTWKVRPDFLESRNLSSEEKSLLEEIIREDKE